MHWARYQWYCLKQADGQHLTLVSNFFPSSTTLPPPAKRPPANNISKSVSPYLEKSRSAPSKTCKRLAGLVSLDIQFLVANNNAGRCRAFYSSSRRIQHLNSGLEIFLKVWAFPSILKADYYCVCKGCWI